MPVRFFCDFAKTGMCAGKNKKWATNHGKTKRRFRNGSWTKNQRDDPIVTQRWSSL